MTFDNVDERKKRTALGLALAVETACRDFELLARMVRGESGMASTSGADYQADATVTMALAKSFVFHAARAVRICEEGAGMLAVPKDDRANFVNGLDKVKLVRGVNEHGFDPKEHPRRRNARPRLHHHELESAIVDETSLVILGHEKILMGPANLADAYPIVARMKDLAGFRALPPEYLQIMPPPAAT